MKSGRTVALAATNAAAATAGERIAEAGGNAVDAAIAASLVTMVNEVGIVSLSSGGFLTVQPADGSSPLTIDGWMDMPGRAVPQRGGGTWDVTTDYGGGVTITVGPGSVATHGAVAAMGEASERWGSLPWAELFGPAIETARNGFQLGTASRFYLDYVHESIFGWDTLSQRAIHDSSGKVTTENIVVPDLAATLQYIAQHGPRSLHDGDLAEAIADDITARGGILSRADLTSYQPVIRPALTVLDGPWAWGTNPPPAVGGVCVAAMLRLLRGYDPVDQDAIIEVQRRVLGERLRVLDHTDDLERDAAAFLDLIDRNQLGFSESGSTANISAVDSDGLACALTVSSGYGSGMIAQGTGIWLNNCLGEKELNPRGLHGLPPGSRLLSNMAPTVGAHADGTVVAVGSPGADRITTAIVQVVTALVHQGEELQQAVDRPRVHVHRAGMPDEDIKIETTPNMYFGGVGVARLDASGKLSAAADPRRDGETRIVTQRDPGNP